MFFVLTVFLSGCGDHSELDDVMRFREHLLSADGCTFIANITADYGNELYTFSVECGFNNSGDMTFSVLSPETICGIQGSIVHEQGTLSFEDKVLLFSLLADGQITPICAPWVIMQAIRGGYIQSCGLLDGNTRVMIDDSYANEVLLVDVYFTEAMTPVSADIMWQNRRILAITIESFSFV